MKVGFGLLELILVIAIGSIMTVTLFRSSAILNTIFSRVMTIIAADVSFVQLQLRLEKDISGIFIPFVAKKIEQKGDDKITLKENNQQSAENDDNILTENKLESSVQYEAKPLDDAFLSENYDTGNVKMLTFITSNPMATYDAAKSRFVRIVYRLESNKDYPELFNLYRQESPLLSLSAFSSDSKMPIRSYCVMKKIKSLVISYKIIASEKQSADSNKNEKKIEASKEVNKKDVKKLYTFSVWKIEDIQKEISDNTLYQPSAIQFNIVIINEQQKQESMEWLFAPIDSTPPIIIKSLKENTVDKSNDNNIPQVSDDGKLMQPAVESLANPINNNNDGLLKGSLL